MMKSEYDMMLLTHLRTCHNVSVTRTLSELPVTIYDSLRGSIIATVLTVTVYYHERAAESGPAPRSVSEAPAGPGGT
eukprot:761390-Hanusia_phi.AAC.2